MHLSSGRDSSLFRAGLEDSYGTQIGVSSGKQLVDSSKNRQWGSGNSLTRVYFSGTQTVLFPGTQIVDSSRTKTVEFPGTRTEIPVIESSGTSVYQEYK